MVPLNQKAFWIYVISGCAMVLAGWCLTQSQGYRIFPSREYVQFQQATKEYQSARDAWTKETNQWGQLRSSWRKRRDIWQQQRAAWEQWSSDHFVQFEQRRFEEALVGTGPTSAIEDVGLRELAETVILLARSSGLDSSIVVTPDERARAISVLVSTDGQGRTWIVMYQAQAVVLLEQRRLAQLLAGDTTVIRPELPERPAAPRHPDPLPNEPVEPTAPIFPTSAPMMGQLPYQGSSYQLPIIWLVASVVFMLGFVLAGLIGYRVNGQSQDFHPLRAFPKFIFGWLVILAAAPGWLLFQFIRLLLSDLGPFWGWLRRKLGRQTEEDQFADLITQLREIEVRAAEREDSELEGKARGLLARVRERRSEDTLAVLRARAGEIGIGLDALDEADRV
ncbi:hypothetical protein A2480_03725 [Candidatus Uhrbacteria bacterium RIFOXYC2_FULL_47_19]|uniref:Uncharacterized protein n=1 Tax=Candidatus Uhrbacteria bacterium RIFOXYC2_FULL_47_19 TaxID=1802424 RepID=A0A1F7WD67_9BACT|nr:MAG: hypothetical protein A2480_03725 [Candidatus Uhrbacteria bacterium RIFOXYC2_FULL_47_19]